MTSYLARARAVWQLPAAVHALRPDSAAWLERVNRRVWRGAFDPVLLELIRIRIARLIGYADGEAARNEVAATAGLSEDKISQLSLYPSSAVYSSLERECLAFAEQFVFDVSGTMRDGLEKLSVAFPEVQLAEFVRAVFVLEFTQRLQLVTDALLDPVSSPTSAVPASPDDGATICDLLAGYQESVVRDSVVDPITTELVRLRCARTHNCRICKTLRLADARDEGADDAMIAKIDRYELSDLPDRVKVALRITDAIITGVGAPPQRLREDARVMFSQLELASLCLDVTKWSTQKVHVALGTDAADRLPLNAAGVSYFAFDDAGKVAGFQSE